MRIRSLKELYCFFKNFSNATVVKENYGGEMREVIYVPAPRGERLRIIYRPRASEVETIEQGFCAYFDQILLGSIEEGFVFFSLYRWGQYVGFMKLEKKQIKKG